MPNAKYATFRALDPFFEVIQQGLSEFVDGDHYFDTIADDALFEFLYYFPGWPKTIHGRALLTREAISIRWLAASASIVSQAKQRFTSKGCCSLSM